MPARVSTLLNNMTSGELSPFLYGRVDLAKYLNGCETLENWMPLRYGGVTSCPGSRFVAETKDSTKASRLVPFVYSTLQAYQLEFGDTYIRFYKDGGSIESPPGTPVEISTPYEEADLPLLKFAQSADVLYIVHPDFALRKLTRTSHTAWTLSVVTLTDGPFLDENDTTGWTISASGDELITNGNFVSDISGWTNASAGGGSIGWNAGQYMNLAESAGKGAAYQGVSTTSGVLYSLTFTVSVGPLMLRIGSSASGQQILADTSKAVGTHTVGFVAVGAISYIEFSNQDAGTTYALDTVSIKSTLATGSAVTLTASQATFEADHVGALWQLSDAGGSSSHDAWKTATAYAVGDRRTYEGNVYEVTVAGTSGTRPPVHLRGTASDGGVTWA